MEAGDWRRGGGNGWTTGGGNEGDMARQVRTAWHGMSVLFEGEMARHVRKVLEKNVCARG